MPKYITLDTASDGNVHINVDQILYAATASSTAGDIFVANGTFFNTKVVISNKSINLLYEIRSMPAGKVSKIDIKTF